jgi:hypothetical protein
VVQGFDNGYMIVGSNSYNGFINKIDSAGNLVWNKVYGDVNNTSINSIIPTYDSCFAIAGMYNGNPFCAKINTVGDTIWLKTINTNGNFGTLFSIKQTLDSGFIMTGYIYYNTAPNYRIFVAKLDSTGNQQWSNIITLGNFANYPHSIKQTPDSGYILTGYMEIYNVNYYAYSFLLKLSNTGTISWANKYELNTSSMIVGNDVMITNNGYLVYQASYNGLVMMQTDFLGNILWNKSYNQYSQYNLGNPTPKLHKTYDGGYVFVNNGDQLGGGILIKTDSLGNYLWSKILMYASIDVIEAKDSGLFMVGNGPMHGVGPITVYSPQIGIIKTDSLGNANNCLYPQNVVSSFDTIIATSTTFTTVSNGTIAAIYPVINTIVLNSDSGCVSFLGGIPESPSNKTEISVYPNPNDGYFTLIYNLSSIIYNSHPQFLIFDITGRKVYTTNLSGTEGTQTISVPDLSNGIYYWEMISDKGIEGKGKIAVIKN